MRRSSFKVRLDARRRGVFHRFCRRRAWLRGIFLHFRLSASVQAEAHSVSGGLPGAAERAPPPCFPSIFPQARLAAQDFLRFRPSASVQAGAHSASGGLPGAAGHAPPERFLPVLPQARVLQHFLSAQRMLRALYPAAAIDSACRPYSFLRGFLQECGVRAVFSFLLSSICSPFGSPQGKYDHCGINQCTKQKGN